FPRGVTGGTFTLTFDGTKRSLPIRYSSNEKETAANIAAALRDLPAVTVTPDGDNLHYTITFVVNGLREALPHDEAAIDAYGLTGDRKAEIGIGEVTDSKFDFKPDAVLHPLLNMFAMEPDTGLDHVQTAK